MNGKILKVKQTNLEFGTLDRYVNVIGCFKYKTNGNVYLIYSDTDPKYNVICYGSGHIRQGVALCMPCRSQTEEEIIKEYIFKIINKDNLDNFEFISLNEINELEIINSTKLEVKSEILTELINLTIATPKIEEEVIDKPKSPKTKKTSLKGVVIGLTIVLILFLAYYLIKNLTTQDKIQKSITCTLNYQHNELNATIEETNEYNFNSNDTLKNINQTLIYQFTENAYQDFILKGTYYKYMPSNKENGTWDKNDEEYTFETTIKTTIDTSYNKPTNYEEVLSYYKNKGYSCTEQIKDN